MIALANAGFRAVVPDMPGFAGTGDFPQWQDFNTARIGEFVLELINTVSTAPVFLVAHDWGATHAWNFTLRHPEAVSRLTVMSVPLRAHTNIPPTEAYKKRFGDQFFYQLYFQRPELPEREFDADARAIISRLLCSPDTPRKKRTVSNSRHETGGWIDRLGEPLELPSWLTNEELDYYANAYAKHGFTGGIHYYRNIDRNWEMMAPYANNVIECPVLFLAGTEDISLMGADKPQLEALMNPRVKHLTMRLFSGKGHWIQQEAEDDVNAELITFLKR